MDFIYPLNLCFQCSGCGLCCGDTPQKTRRILLLSSEAQIISAQTGLTIADFAQPTANQTPYFYEMKKLQDGKCFFLKNNQCIIYSYRPLICHFYPFELKYSPDQAAYVFKFTSECPALGRGRALSKKDFEELFELASERLP